MQSPVGHRQSSMSCHVVATSSRVFNEAAQEPRPPDGLPHRASHHRPANVWILHGQDTIPEAWNFALTSCLCPATRNPGPTMSSTQNLAEYEVLKRRFHDTAYRCHQNGLRFTPVVFDGHAGGWGDSAYNSSTALHTPRDMNLDLALRVSSSPHRDSARPILRRVRLPQERPLPSPDDWEMSGDDSLMTTMTSGPAPPSSSLLCVSLASPRFFGPASSSSCRRCPVVGWLSFLVPTSCSAWGPCPRRRIPRRTHCGRLRDGELPTRIFWGCSGATSIWGRATT